MAAEMLSRSTDSAVPCVSVHARACVRSRQHTHPRTHGTHTLLSKTIETEDAVNMGNQKAPWTAAMGDVDGCLALCTKCMCYVIFQSLRRTSVRTLKKTPGLVPAPEQGRQGSPFCVCSASAGPAPAVHKHIHVKSQHRTSGRQRCTRAVVCF